MPDVNGEPRSIKPIEIVNFHHDHFKQTREIQWKLNLALWSLLVGGIALGVTKAPRFNSWLVGFAGVACVVFHAVSACLQQESLNYDKVRWNHYLPDLPPKVTGQATSKSPRIIRWACALQGNSFIWILLQTAITIVLALFMFSSLTGLWMRGDVAPTVPNPQSYKIEANDSLQTEAALRKHSSSPNRELACPSWVNSQAVHRLQPSGGSGRS